ncbi:ankyrin repeat protein [Reticulomyxa filosa]|uniref:Ankyrin repeat protein n=1 Tax=Reticulomyxa filosa TaxID=46433 RepID=X6MMZ4_RETFI|nr:ankyrin repeat protein [Reticulomyxa filosa]|eukprot:ETO15031.1 ankyrin repeat protein [Reticulomyxa filosa]
MKQQIDIRDRQYRMKRYKQCFVAKEAVGWLVQNRAISGCQSEQDAVALCNLFVHFRIIDKARKKHKNSISGPNDLSPFVSGSKYFYVFTESRTNKSFVLHPKCSIETKVIQKKKNVKCKTKKNKKRCYIGDSFEVNLNKQIHPALLERPGFLMANASTATAGDATETARFTMMTEPNLRSEEQVPEQKPEQEQEEKKNWLLRRNSNKKQELSVSNSKTSSSAVSDESRQSSPGFKRQMVIHRNCHLLFHLKISMKSRTMTPDLTPTPMPIPVSIPIPTLTLTLNPNPNPDPNPNPNSDENTPYPMELFHVRDLDFLLVYHAPFQNQWQQLIKELLQEYSLICSQLDQHYETTELRAAIGKADPRQSYLECLLRLESTIVTGREIKDHPWIRLEANRRNTKKFGQDLVLMTSYMKPNDIHSMHELMRQVPDLNTQNKDGQTALHIALTRSIKEPAFSFVARYLALQHVVSRQMIQDSQILIHALTANNPVVVEMLLALEPKLNVKDKYGRTGNVHVLDIALSKNYYGLANEMMHINPPPWLKPLLIEKWFGGVSRGDVVMLRSCINEGMHVDFFHQDSQETALILATKQGHINAVQYLLYLNCNINAYDMYGRASIHYAAMNLNTSIFRLLAQNGAVLTSRDNDFRTPVDYVLERIGLKVVQANLSNYQPQTPTQVQEKEREREKNSFAISQNLRSNTSKLAFFIRKGGSTRTFDTNGNNNNNNTNNNNNANEVKSDSYNTGAAFSGLRKERTNTVGSNNSRRTRFDLFHLTFFFFFKKQMYT